MADNLTREQRSKTMSRIRRRDTKPERLLRQAVWARGLRGYRLDDRRLPGRPDLAWTRKKSRGLHRRRLLARAPKAFTHGKSGTYWDEKIAAQHRRATEWRMLRCETMGWTVFRFWDFEVRKECERCVDAIEAALIAMAVPDGHSRREPPSRRGKPIAAHQSARARA